MTFDLKITGGLVLDGTGAPGRTTDIGIAGDRIAAIGDLEAVDARQVISAAGCYVCPGFIDVHSHSDAYLLIEPSAPSKIYQGVTTEVVGNCGASAAPRTGAYQIPADWREKKYPGTWSTVAEYRRLLEAAKPAVNVVLLIGHNTLRAGAMGYEGRPATAEEVRRMTDLLAQALDEGGAGLSTGLIYAPGLFAERGEILALARLAAQREKIYTSHMRSEGGQLLEAIEETLGVNRETGVRVEISHLKTAGRNNWSKVDAALALIRHARDKGQDVAADRYPYTASSTDLDVVLPDWAAEGGRESILKRLRDPATRARLREELVQRRDATYWNSVLIGSTFKPENERFKGMPLVEAARQLGSEPVDAALHLMDTDELHTGAIFFGMSEENMEKILREPYVMIGSDASLRSPQGPLSQDHPHPRAYGTFPKLLRAALDGAIVPLPEMVRKMTSLPAQHFRLKDRGRLQPGSFADVIVFDPGEVRDNATYAHPHQLASGLRTVCVNGRMVLNEGKFTGTRSGRFLD